MQLDPANIKKFLELIGMAKADPVQFFREILPNQQRVSVSLENLEPPKPFGDNFDVGAAAGTVILDYTFADDGLLTYVRTLNIIMNGFTAATVDNIQVQIVSFETGEVTTLLVDATPSVTVIATIEFYSNSPDGGGANATFTLQNEFPRIFYPKDRILVRIEVSVGTCPIGIILDGETFPPGCRPTFV